MNKYLKLLIVLTFFAHCKNRVKTFRNLQSGQVEVCKHPKGAFASFTTSTDTYALGHEKNLMYLYKNNAKATIFDNDVSTSDKVSFHKTNAVDFGIYIDITKQAELIAEPADFTVLDGMISDVTTTNDGKVPLVCSFGNGIDSYKTKLYTRFLGGRNSSHANIGYPNGDGGANNNIDVYKYSDLTKEELISRPSTNRYVYYTNSINNPADFFSGTVAMGYRDFRIKVEKTLQKSGFYTAFGHWHWVTDNDFDLFLGKLREYSNGYDVYFSTYNELAEYYFVKDAIDSVSLTGLTITVDYTEKDVSRPYDDITYPAWIMVNLEGTALEGLPIQTDISTQIIKKADNLYAIGFPLNFALTTMDIVLSEAVDETGYNNETIPVVSVNTGTGLITSDQPINYTLFKKTKAQQEWEVVIEEFEATFSASHTILATLNTATYDYYLGFGNEFKQFGRIQF